MVDSIDIPNLIKGFGPAMGVPVLFYYSDRFEKLQNVFPKDQKSWFVLCSTIFSTLWAIYLQTSFISMHRFVMPLWTAIAAFGLLVIYYLLIILPSQLQPQGKQHNKNKKPSRRTILTRLFNLLQLIIYCFIFLGLTYSYNIIILRGSYTIIRGFVYYNKSEFEHKMLIGGVPTVSIDPPSISCSRKTGYLLCIGKVRPDDVKSIAISWDDPADSRTVYELPNPKNKGDFYVDGKINVFTLVGKLK
jgi:hypothetical protein